VKLVSGIDIIEIERVKRALERYGVRFLTRIYTAQEIDDARGNPASLAARFAAKEAVAKALGCGIGAIHWQEIEIQKGAQGEPLLFLYGNALQLAKNLGLNVWSISLSHSRDYAVAMAVAIESPDCEAARP